MGGGVSVHRTQNQKKLCMTSIAASENPKSCPENEFKWFGHFSDIPKFYQKKTLFSLPSANKGFWKDGLREGRKGGVRPLMAIVVKPLPAPARRAAQSMEPSDGWADGGQTEGRRTLSPSFSLFVRRPQSDYGQKKAVSLSVPHRGAAVAHPTFLRAYLVRLNTLYKHHWERGREDGEDFTFAKPAPPDKKDEAFKRKTVWEILLRKKYKKLSIVRLLS